MRVLIIEDEYKLGEYVRKGLSEQGFVVEVSLLPSAKHDQDCSVN